MRARGQNFRISPSGKILQFGNIYNKMSNDWKVLGFTKHHWSNSPVPFKEAIKKPKNIIKSIIWDIDHKTTGSWGGSYYGKLPRVESFYPIKSRKRWYELQKGEY
jgi:hypothetical protein